ncbi:MAG: hypothetical protein SVU32_07930 [Candidatus Nanohaloarchaea archaeon]|nr:hypothetical protein [Candidatus Nanohaloarchaea archaeon]
MKCDKCGRKVESRREEIEHLLEQHDDKITSHEKDELKRELNQMDTGGVTDSLPLRKLGIAAAVIAVLAGGGYGLLQTGIVTFSTDASPTGSFAVGAAGSAHDHAQFTVTVNGEEVVPAPNLQGLDSRAHFEGDGVIHAHATGVTPGYVFSTFEDALGSKKWNISRDSVTIAGNRYVDGRGANISITANGQPVDSPSDYRLNTARSFRITVEGEATSRSADKRRRPR